MMNAPPKHLTVRNVPPKLAKAIAAVRRSRGLSLNRTVIDLLERAVGERRTNGLERFAGTWSAAEGAAFDRATRDRVDRELWK